MHFIKSPKVHETERNELHDTVKLGGSGKLLVLHHEEKPVGFVDERGKPKADLGPSYRKQADKCMP